ncbi:MAG: manganese efflux pump MntP family protein [Bulleidia sp.]
MIWALFILLGLSLDSAIVMMEKGSQLTSLSWKNTFAYSLLFAGVTLLTFSIGYGIAYLLEPYAFTVRVQNFIACAAVMCIGVTIVTKAFLRKELVEHADRDFCWKDLVRKAFITNIDAYVVGAGMGLIGVPLFHAAFVLTISSFCAVLISLRAGYSLGAGYQRAIGVIGGSLVIVFSVYLAFIILAVR